MTGPREIHPTKRNTKVQRMRRGGHTYIFGHPNEYREPMHRRRYGFGSGVIRTLRNILNRAAAKRARIARKISRPTY